MAFGPPAARAVMWSSVPPARAPHREQGSRRIRRRNGSGARHGTRMSTAAITNPGPGTAARTRAPARRRSGPPPDVIQQRDRRADNAMRGRAGVIADHAAATELRSDGWCSLRDGYVCQPARDRCRRLPDRKGLDCKPFEHPGRTQLWVARAGRKGFPSCLAGARRLPARHAVTDATPSSRQGTPARPDVKAPEASTGRDTGRSLTPTFVAPHRLTVSAFRRIGDGVRRAKGFAGHPTRAASPLPML